MYIAVMYNRVHIVNLLVDISVTIDTNLIKSAFIIPVPIKKSPWANRYFRTPSSIIGFNLISLVSHKTIYLLFVDLVLL